MSWAHLKGKHQTTHRGRIWYLAPAGNGSRWPWVLFTVTDKPEDRPHYGPATTRTEIGSPDLESALHAAETWLDLSKYCI